jgi:DNA repair protein RadC
MTNKQQLYEFKVRRKPRAFDKGNTRIDGPEAAGRLLVSLCSDLDREHFFTVYLDVRGKVIGYETTAIGQLSGVSVAPPEVFRGAILAGAYAIILGHNHPSGDPTPSPEDVDLAKRMYRAGMLLGIEVLDSVVIANKEVRSLADCLKDSAQ